MSGSGLAPASAAIVNYNGGARLAACVDSLLAQGDAVGEILVLDNASTDGSLQTVWARSSRVHVVELGHNLGYAAAANVAVARTRTPYLLLLNHDVVLAPTFVRELVSFAEAHPSAGSFTGKLLRFEMREGRPVIDSTGHLLFRDRLVVNRGEATLDVGQYAEPEEVFGVCGAAPLYRRAMLEDVRVNGQVFAESFFLYLEDVDLDWRARLRGWRAYYVPTAVAHHERGYKGGRRPGDSAMLRHALKNRYLVMARNDSLGGLVRDARAIAALELLRAIEFLLADPRALAGYADAVRLLSAALREGREIRRRARVSDREIRRWARDRPHRAVAACVHLLLGSLQRSAARATPPQELR
jgi:GT2 family glycosyltransferase